MTGRKVFSSDVMQGEPSEKARFHRWRELHDSAVAAVDFSASPSRRFEATFEGTTIGQITSVAMSGTLMRSVRGRSRIAGDSNDRYVLFINLGTADMVGTQLNRPFTMRPGGGTLMDMGEASEVTAADDQNRWFNLMLPRPLLIGMEQKVAMPIAAQNRALALLHNYCRMLEAEPGISDVRLIAHVLSLIHI